MAEFISNSYDDLEDILNNLKSLKLKSYLGENVVDCHAAILVDTDQLESEGRFNTENLDYINHIFEDNSDYQFSISMVNKYKEVMYPINKLHVCELDII